jgi:ABC-type phosphate transport system substrate-binding protein
VALASLGVVVPGVAALYEFVLKGRKRLGYRVQMDTTATDVVATPAAGALDQLQHDGRRLTDPTLVLLRIENSGATNIDTSDYAVLDDDKVGVRVRFPGRRVAGMVVTELSDDFLRACFGAGSGLAVRDNVIELPKVPLNRNAHYKVLAALERGDGHTGKAGQYEQPVVVGGIKGGVNGGTISETHSRTGTSRRTIGLVLFLVAVVLAQLVLFLRSIDAAPLDCATGEVTVVGSTAFEPIVREATRAYTRRCPGSRFTVDARGSGDGLRAVARSRSAQTLAFSDGAKPDGYPGLLPRPISFLLFTLVANPRAGVQDLSLDQVRRIYAGQVTNWKQVGGNDVPVSLISRNPGSGTRATFQRQVLGGAREPGTNSDDCTARDPGAPPGVVRCARDTTAEVLRTVADVPGGLGYSEVGAAASAGAGVVAVRLGGHRATVAEADGGAYPFWETEYGYTYGEPAAESLTASFLRFLTNQVGADILRAHGNRPCGELQNPALCRPAAPSG